MIHFSCFNCESFCDWFYFTIFCISIFIMALMSRFIIHKVYWNLLETTLFLLSSIRIVFVKYFNMIFAGISWQHFEFLSDVFVQTAVKVEFFSLNNSCLFCKWFEKICFKYFILRPGDEKTFICFKLFKFKNWTEWCKIDLILLFDAME